MNYLCKNKETGVLFVATNVTKDWSKHIESKQPISLGRDFFYVIQEIEVR